MPKQATPPPVLFQLPEFYHLQQDPVSPFFPVLLSAPVRPSEMCIFYTTKLPN